MTTFELASSKRTRSRMRSGWRKSPDGVLQVCSGERRLSACSIGQLAECIRFQFTSDYQPMLAAGCRQLPRKLSGCSPEMKIRWIRKDLIGLRELSSDEINFILETADAFKQVGTREIK